MPAADKCPLCGGHILYLGAILAECDGSTCPNRAKDVPRDLLEQIKTELADMYLGWYGCGP